MGYSGDKVTDLTDRLQPAVNKTGRAIATAFRDAGKKNIRAKTPVDTRHLRDSYKVTKVGRRAVLTPSGFSVYAWTGEVYTEVEYAEWVEIGTGLFGPRHAKFKIQPKKPGGRLKFTVGVPHGGVVLQVPEKSPSGATIYARYVMHPGSPGAYMFKLGAVITEKQFREIAADPLRGFKRMVEHGA